MLKFINIYFWLIIFLDNLINSQNIKITTSMDYCTGQGHLIILYPPLDLITNKLKSFVRIQVVLSVLWSFCVVFP